MKKYTYKAETYKHGIKPHYPTFVEWLNEHGKEGLRMVSMYHNRILDEITCIFEKETTP